MLLNELVSAGHNRLLIGGDWVDGSGSIEVVDPATESVLAEVALAGPDEAMAAVDAAEEASAGWASTPPRERGEVLRRGFEIMRAREEGLAELIALENGKAFNDALGEVRYAAEFFRWFSEEAVRIGGEIRIAPGGDKRIITSPRPVGISMLITPWNFPAAMATRKLGPALAAGCTAILKPASATPLTALAVAAILEESGLPPGVVNVIAAQGSSGVVEGILDDERVRKLSFTGSTEVGRSLLGQASNRILRTSMELGGNAPFVVFEDADIEEAVAGAMVAKMRNAGEACTAANRFLVHDAVVDEFSSRLAESMGSMRLGPGIERDTEVGPMINSQARDEIASLVSGAVGGGAHVATGGSSPDRQGFFYSPTVLTGVASTDPILDHEIFGPVAPIVTFSDEAEGVSLSNATPFGLIAYVYTGDLGRGLRVAEQIEAGMVGLNRGLVSDPAAPFGGVKQSGLGREGGREGILEYLETQYIATQF